MKKVMALLVLLSMTTTVYAQSVHWYVCHAKGSGSSSMAASTASSVTSAYPDDSRSDQGLPDRSRGATDHCDLCVHAGLVAIGTKPVFVTAVVSIVDRVVPRPESPLGDPPLQGADEPPR